MSGPASGDAFLVAKCLEFCQALSSQGQVFNISISTGSGFSFSLDTRSKASPSQSPKKKASPSTLRRNAKRREEFLAKKQQSSPTTDSGGDEAVAEALKCDQCEYVGASEKGLKQHMRMKHKKIAPLQSTPEIPRNRDASSLQEENPSNANGTDCTCSNSQCCDCNHDHSCECYKSSKLTSFCDCEDVSGLRCRLR